MIKKSELVSIFAIISTTLTLSSCNLNKKNMIKPRELLKIWLDLP